MRNRKYLAVIFTVTLFSFTQLKAESYVDSIECSKSIQAFIKGNNFHRYRYIKKNLKKENTGNIQVTTEGIDWLGVYRNVVVEKKGESDSIVYIVCHYDKTDGNLLGFINHYFNGNLDLLFSNLYLSKGAYDNGSGVMIALKLLADLSWQNTHYTYRFLFAGMEEAGLRGSRRHVSAMSIDEWKKVFYMINIDMVGKKGRENISITENVSSPRLMQIAEEVSRHDSLSIEKNLMPPGALSDYYSFKGQSFGRDFLMAVSCNLAGSLVLQRSYITGRKPGVPVLNFTDSASITYRDFLSILSPVAFGSEHSYKDRINIVDTAIVINYSRFIKDLIEFIEEKKSL